MNYTYISVPVSLGDILFICAVILFIAFIVGIYWWLHKEEKEQQMLASIPKPPKTPIKSQQTDTITKLEQAIQALKDTKDDDMITDKKIGNYCTRCGKRVKKYDLVNNFVEGAYGISMRVGPKSPVGKNCKITISQVCIGYEVVE